jgi:hypothetical protein
LERQRAGDIAHGEVRLQISVLPPYRNSTTICICHFYRLIAKPNGSGFSEVAATPPADKQGRKCQNYKGASGSFSGYTWFDAECPVLSIVLDTGTPPKCSRSRLSEGIIF